MTPYDWQESVSRRAEYVESRLGGGLPAVAVSLPEGVVVAALRRQSQKVFEIYDHLAMTALGAQADVEALRVAAIEFCHKEGYQRSVEDVTLKRLINGLSESVRGSFSNLRVAPLVCRALFVELGSAPGDDRFSILEYDGDFSETRGMAALAGTSAAKASLEEALSGELGGVDEVLPKLESALLSVAGDGPATFEASLLSRTGWSERRMKRLA